MDEGLLAGSGLGGMGGLGSDFFSRVFSQAACDVEGEACFGGGSDRFFGWGRLSGEDGLVGLRGDVGEAEERAEEHLTSGGSADRRATRGSRGSSGSGLELEREASFFSRSISDQRVAKDRPLTKHSFQPLTRKRCERGRLGLAASSQALAMSLANWEGDVYKCT